MVDSSAHFAQPKVIPNRNDLLPNLEVSSVAISDLKPSKQRVRKTSKKQVGKQVRSIEAYGFLVPVLIGDANGIIDGHTRVEAGRQLGLKTVPCIRISHLSDREVRALRIALNKIQETGAWEIGRAHV